MRSHAGRFALLSVLVSLVAVLSVGGCKKKESEPTIDGLRIDDTIPLVGLSADVDIVRDEFGRPHIYGATLADVSMAAGWVHAEDRFIQMDLQRRFAAGEVADLVGALLPTAVESDKRMRTLGLKRTAQAIYDGLDANSDEKIAFDAYAAGVNAKLATFTTAPAAEYQAFGYPWADTPAWTPVDSLVIGRLLAFNLSWGGNTKLKLAEGLTALAAEFPTGDPREGIVSDLWLRISPPANVPIVDPTQPSASSPPIPTVSLADKISTRSAAPRASLAAAGEVARAILEDPFNFQYDEARGSNSWVVGPARSATGNPLLANDPHLGLSAPPIWYELHLNTTHKGGDLDVIGVSLAGVPMVIIGANGKVAWGFTTNPADVSDIYVEHYSEGTGNGGVDQVEWDADGLGGAAGGLVDLVEEIHQIQVRQIGGSTTTVEETVWRVPHRNGVIVPGTLVNGTALSWSWTGFEATSELNLFYRLARAETAAEVDAATDLFEVPAHNVVFADVEGNFGYMANGWFPIRGDDDGDIYTDPPFLPMPGWTGTHEWDGRVARALMPQEFNPARGWLATANQDPAGFTHDNDPLNDDFYLSAMFDNGFRGERITEVLFANDAVTVEDMMALQGDHASPLGRRFLPFIVESLASGYPDEVALLQAWGDRGFYASSGVGNDLPATTVDDSAATSLFNIWLVAMGERALGDELDAAGLSPGDQRLARGLLYLLEHPEEALTYDGISESVLWDDLNTGAVETRDDIFVAAMEEALAVLASSDGFNSSDPDDWRWGLLHRAVMPRITGLSNYNIPGPDDPVYSEGYPRSGDMFVVDVANPGLSDYNFKYSGGPSMRMVIELDPDGIRFYNHVPGGSSADPESVHYADQALNWATNTHEKTWFRERDVAGNAESRIVLTP